jgi:hypothetical protein
MSAKCNLGEAAECLLPGLYRKNKEAFTSVALEIGLIMDEKKKMDAVEVEVMLSEEGLCKDNSRILFRPIFWEEHFESEYKTCAFLPELNFHLSQTKWFFRIQPSWIIGSSSLM